MVTMFPTTSKATVIAGQRLTPDETRVVERVLRMGAGYVLDFSDRTIKLFFAEFDVDILGPRFADGPSGGKANRVRSFLRQGPAPLVGRVMSVLLQHGIETEFSDRDDNSAKPTVDELESYRRLVARFGWGTSAAPGGRGADSPSGAGPSPFIGRVENRSVGGPGLPAHMTHEKRLGPTAVLSPTDVSIPPHTLGAVSSSDGAQAALPVASEAERPSVAIAGLVYDVALSFAGEDREAAEAIASLCRRKGISVFYDDYEKATLWGKDLYQHLSEVYANRAKFCVVFVSRHYAAKLWTNHELRAAQSRAFREKREYILPLRLDDSQLPGLTETTGYVEWGKHNPDQIVEMLAAKVHPSDDGPQLHASALAMLVCLLSSSPVPGAWAHLARVQATMDANGHSYAAMSLGLRILESEGLAATGVDGSRNPTISLTVRGEKFVVRHPTLFQL